MLSQEKILRQPRSADTVFGHLEIQRLKRFEARNMDHVAMQDFHDAARDHGLWKERQFDDGELSQSFNEAAEIAEVGGDGDDDESYAPDWARDADDDDDDDDPRRRRRDRGYGYRRDAD